MLEAFSVPLFGWFACGVFAFRFHRRGTRIDLVLSGALGTMATLISRDDLWTGGCTLLLLAAFLLALRSGPLVDLFNCRPLLFIASISYPLFLLHEQALVALIIRSERVLGAVPQILLPVLPIAVLILLSWAVARVVEPPLRRGIHRVVMTVRRTLPREVKDQLRPWMTYARNAGSLS